MVPSQAKSYQAHRKYDKGAKKTINKESSWVFENSIIDFCQKEEI